MKPYQNKSLPPHERAADLLTKLTSEEKIAQLGGWIMPSATASNIHLPDVKRKKRGVGLIGCGAIYVAIF